jgi:hypothetical protein
MSSEQGDNPATCVVILDHHPETDDVLDVARGEILKFEHRETIYPGWIWCIQASGHQAWVPEAFVVFEEGGCRMQRDYVSRELAIKEGEVVEVAEVTSGWGWVCNQMGEWGWVPLQCLDYFTLKGSKSIDHFRSV